MLMESFEALSNTRTPYRPEVSIICGREWRIQGKGPWLDTAFSAATPFTQLRTEVHSASLLTPIPVKEAMPIDASMLLRKRFAD